MPQSDSSKITKTFWQTNTKKFKIGFCAFMGKQEIQPSNITFKLVLFEVKLFGI
jgi:hypothetical protein